MNKKASGRSLDHKLRVISPFPIVHVIKKPSSSFPKVILEPKFLTNKNTASFHHGPCTCITQPLGALSSFHEKSMKYVFSKGEKHCPPPNYRGIGPQHRLHWKTTKNKIGLRRM